MKFACPQCSSSCGLFKGVCPNCGFSLSLGSVVKFYGRRLREFLTNATALRCPQCSFANPVKARRCEHCQSDLTVRLAVHAVVDPPRRRWHNFLRAIDPQTKRRLRWAYFVFSAALLWWLLAYAETKGSTLFMGMALSVIYVAVLAFFALWLIPRQIFRNVFRRATPLVKLSLALNALALMLALQLLIQVWWARALILAALFVVAWVGAWVLHRLILTMANETAAVFLGDDAPEYDSRSPQGRHARFD